MIIASLIIVAGLVPICIWLGYWAARKEEEKVVEKEANLDSVHFFKWKADKKVKHHNNSRENSPWFVQKTSNFGLRRHAVMYQRKA